MMTRAVFRRLTGNVPKRNCQLSKSMFCKKRSLCASSFLSLAACFGLVSLYADETPKEAAGEKKESIRFDQEVRDDFFSGFNGDENALKKGIEVCEKVLAENPKHAEALVWLGSGQVYLSGKAFSTGKSAEGMKLWQEGITNMDKAAELEPKNIGVLIPRAAVLMPASRGLPDLIKKPVLQGVLKNFEDVYEMQKGFLSEIGEHPLGELRMGLADVHRSLGNLDDSKTHLEAVIKELPDTEYAEKAERWLAAKPTDRLAHNCIGCHSK
jgi:tetratricopeptide (TPR) repeat protein